MRPLWDGDQPDADALVEFEVVNADPAGELLAAENLAVTVVREYPDYYWEYNANAGWERNVNYQHYPVARFKLDVPAGAPAKISFPVEWGPYRLEVRNPRTGLMTSYRFSAGWSWWGRGANQQGSRPDQVVLTLDKPAYNPGDTAKVWIKAPEAGTALVSVEGDRPLWSTIVEVKAGGSEVSIPVSATWDRHDLYISALVIRPGDRRRKITPKRALGLIHLPLDRGARRLALTIEAPEKVLPNTPLTVNLHVDGALGRGEAYVTLAAVDVGALAITDFKTPDPAAYFFNRRRYGVDCYDLYQKIIENGEGPPARRRFGGGAMPRLNRGGDKPLTDVRIVSLYRGRLAVDEQGRASAVMDMPDFNGKLRLMAVAYSDSTYGVADKEVTVAAPVVAEIAMPRFLALDDSAFLALDVQNLSGLPQALSVHLAATPPIVLVDQGDQQFKLADKQKVTLRYAIRAGQSAGLGDIDLRIEGIRPRADAASVTLQRQWRLGTRPAYPAVTRQWRKSLEPGQALTIDPRVLENLMPATVHAGLTLSGHPPIDVARHVRELFAYPYGCLEQTASGIYPQVFLSREALDQLGVKTQEEKLRRRKVAKGIDRLLSLQKSSGGFGLWSDSSPEECWLSAYVTDFLITARDQGFEVPDEALARALDRLAAYLRKPGTVIVRYSEDTKHARLSAMAYSGYVLARINRAPLGTLRSLFDNHAADSLTGLPLVHLGVALELQGDRRRARQAYARALEKRGSGNRWYGDYGSPLRDAAMAFVLLSTHAPGRGDAAQWLIKLDEALHGREWLSTQERNALV
ncbi:MAG: alpha-2-macroglobulin family protein, partial [Desulfosarcinaceae bacterium]